MHNSNIPPDSELPSTEKLIKSTAVAALVATILLLVAILPAEYGIDPTGIGRILGLSKMGEIKVSLAQEAAIAHIDQANSLDDSVLPASEAKAAITSPVSTASEQALLSHEMEVSLVPNEGTEIKVDMVKGGKVTYAWWTDGGRANFDVHGDSKKLNISYHNYSKGSEARSEGVIEAAFDGSHGWFWRNRTSKAMTITLRTSGDYTDIKHLK